MATKAQLRAIAKYEREKVKRKVVKFFPGDAELLAFLESHDNEGGYIKDLIRRDMELEGWCQSDNEEQQES